MITQAELKEVLSYNPKTGDFIWLNAKRNSKLNGCIAGSFCHGYRQIKINQKIYSGHWLAWLYVHGVWPKEQLDHVNHVRDDNRIINLREATNKENGRNVPLGKANKSGVVGVRWCNASRKWKSTIRVNLKSIHLGYFCDKFEAVCSRLSANNKYGFHENHGREL